MSPTVYKAGRYGFGETSAAALEDLGFDVDISINPRMNFAGQGGPDFSFFDTRPFLFGRTRRLLECTLSDFSWKLKLPRAWMTLTSFRFMK
mgnify:CR=1 FL=1